MRAEQAGALLVARGLEPEIFLTERPGHARELAASALARGASLVLAWGGDGTVNEVASALAFRDAALAVIPSGSGNGLARELGIPLDPAGAFAVAFDGRDLVMDAGELDGHLFFNIAGIGLDARVAHEFSAGGLVRRGLARYLEITARELFTYTPDEHTIVTDGDSLRERTLLIAIANARQYRQRRDHRARGARRRREAGRGGDRASLALASAAAGAARSFRGESRTFPASRSGRRRTSRSHRRDTVLYHVDGEPFVGGASIRARIRPRAVRIKVPRALQVRANVLGNMVLFT